MDFKIMSILAIFCLASLMKSVAPCYCGVPNRGTRIVNGVETEPNEYPWQVGLVNSQYGKVGYPYTQNIKKFRTQPYCGGSLIDSMTVLTAAHCTSRATPRDIIVLVGEHDTQKQDGQIRIGIKEIINHPKYKKALYDNDYSLLVLNETIRWSKIARPVCLPAGDSSSYEDITATVSGWGKLKARGKDATTLQEVGVTTMKNSACSSSHTEYSPYQITSNMICAAQPEKDSCQQDSGGPLVAKEAGGYYSQIGVVSWGNGCAKPAAPGVYARVTQKLDWIKKNMQGDTCPTPPKGTPGLLRCKGQDNKCCTKETPCDEGEGDCDSNDHCRGELVCGNNNCPNRGFKWDRSDDCCFSFADKPGPTRCSKKEPCGEGHGDCSSDKHCEEGLVCGDHNCDWDRGIWDWWKDDCCEKK